MIRLRIRAEAAEAWEPFIARLSSKREGSTEGEAYLSMVDAHSAEYVSQHGRLRLFGTTPDELDGDVLLVIPQKQVAHRLIRKRSEDNTFVITERCDQLCVMCSQPPKSGHVDLFAQFEKAALLAPHGMTIGISGGEPTLYKNELFRLLRAVTSARPDLRFHVLTNAQHFETDDRNFLKGLPVDRVLWGIPLYAACAETHDAIVGKSGAHATVLDALALLCRTGAMVELRTALMQSNAIKLPLLAKMVSINLRFIKCWAVMQLEHIGYARRAWKQIFFDSSLDFTPIAQSIDISRAKGIDVYLYNFPLCTVPAPYRQLALKTISDWKVRYLNECETCVVKNRCTGFFDWYPEDNGFAKIGLM